MASHRAIMNETVEKERSPPDRHRVSFVIFLVPCSTFTWKTKCFNKMGTIWPRQTYTTPGEFMLKWNASPRKN